MFVRAMPASIDPSSCADAFNIDVILIDELQTAVAAAPFGELIPVAVDAAAVAAVRYLRFQLLFLCARLPL